ncbi:MAG: MarR family transcriptional regulator [Alphaproteobacteria bacterium]
MSKAREIVENLDRLGRLTRAVQFSDCLNPAQWEALRYLSQANRYSRTPGALAEFLGATKGTVSQTLSALEEKGLLARIRSESDRRCIDLVLTEAGQALVRRDPLRDLERAVARLDEAALASMNAMLDGLLRDIRSCNESRDFGVCSRCERLVPLDAGAQQAPGYRCGLTGESVGDSDTRKLCANFSCGDQGATG